ncbi:hypothetical protein [Pedobacter sp. GR22-6]|uniref:hypothetical protein n=1 Tax=Pedobacter sp. GR22-6 TaxID=3127957 RepID=UPI00307E6D01
MEERYHNFDHSRQNTEIQQPIQPKKKRRTILWVMLVLLLLIGVSGFAYFYGSYQARKDFYQTGDDVAYPADSVYVDGWASPADYANWKDAVFTIPQYDDIPVSFKRGIVKIFMDNDYLNKESSEIYFFTKIKDRAYRVIAYGNFTGQGEREMAFLLESADYESSAIFIIPQKGNVLYWKKLPGELPTIKSFKKGDLIYMDKTELVPAPVDGIIRQTKSSKYVLIYNQQTKTFSEYYQYTNEDINNIREERSAEEEEVPDSTDAE